MRWSEAAFWDCSWRGLLDAWVGYRRFALGLDPDDEPLTQADAAALDRAVLDWQRTGHWGEVGDG